MDGTVVVFGPASAPARSRPSRDSGPLLAAVTCRGWRVAGVYWCRVDLAGSSSEGAVDAHLRVHIDRLGYPDRRRLAEMADVLVGQGGPGPSCGPLAVQDVLTRFPGCLVAAVPHAHGGVIGWRRGNQTETAVVSGGRGRPSGGDLGLVASLVHARLVSGQPALPAPLLALADAVISPRARRTQRGRAERLVRLVSGPARAGGGHAA